MNIACPHCHGLMVGDQIAPGAQVICPHCRVQFVMAPAAAPAQSRPAPVPATGRHGPQPAPAGPQGPLPVGRGPGPLPAGTAGAPLPGAGGQAPRPAGPAAGSGAPVRAAWSDVGRRKRSPLQSSNFAIGVMLVVALVGILLGLFFFVLARPARKSAPVVLPKTVELDARVTVTPTEVTVTNANRFDWVDVVMRVNPGAGSDRKGFSWEADRIKSGRAETYRLNRFADSAGNHFDPQRAEVVKLDITAQTPDGRGSRMVTRK